MGNVFFTADTHFGHRNIIGFCNRPYSSVEEMDEALIENWNAVVKRGDVVWHLGDFAFHREVAVMQAILDRLSGTKHLISGNHDHEVLRLIGWRSVSLMNTSFRAGGYSFHLCHYPLLSWKNSLHGRLHLHGHTHGTIPSTMLRADVGVDVMGYRPIEVSELLERMKTFPPHAHADLTQPVGGETAWT